MNVRRLPVEVLIDAPAADDDECALLEGAA